MQRVKISTWTMMVMLVASASAADKRPDFNALYDYYFPKRCGGLRNDYREAFDEMLYGLPLSAEYRLADRQLYAALHGDTAAFHAFVNNQEREGEGHFAEEWVYKCVLLLLWYGDDRFSQLLAREDRKTCEAVGIAIDQQIDWDEHQFPKTRALYTFRNVPQSLEEVRERHRFSTITAMLNLKRPEVTRLRTAIMKDQRFCEVVVLTRGNRAMIMVSMELPSATRNDLVRLVERVVPSQGPVRFESSY